MIYNMAKKNSPKKQTISIKKEPILWIVIAVLIALLMLSVWYIVKAPEDTSNNNLSSAFSEHVAQEREEGAQRFVNDVEERRYRYPVIDVKEERMYIPEARAYAPLSEESRDMRYQTWGDGTIWLSQSIAVGRQTGNEDASCDRVVIVTPLKQRAKGYIEEGTIKSKDGDSLYIFRHPATCKLYEEEFSKRLADVAKKMQYY